MGVRVPLRGRDGHVRAYALIDDDDAHLAERCWHLDTDGYAIRIEPVNGRKTTVALHRSVLGLVHGDGLQGDHINRDRLDNRRANLRVVTSAQNRQNVASKPGSASRHRGVSWNTSLGKWKATACVNGRKNHLGYFDNEDDAAEAARVFRVARMPFAVEVVAMGAGWRN